MQSNSRYKNPQINLRIPQEIKEKIAAAAKVNKRSMNAEIISRLEQSLNQQSKTILENMADFEEGPVKLMLELYKEAKTIHDIKEQAYKQGLEEGMSFTETK